MLALYVSVDVCMGLTYSAKRRNTKAFSPMMFALCMPMSCSRPLKSMTSPGMKDAGGHGTARSEL